MNRETEPLVKVYMADVEQLRDPEVFAMRYAEVSDERRRKIDKLRRNEDKLLSLGAECLLMKACEDFGISYQNATVLADENGKPYFKDIPFYFNLSHSGDRVMCIMSDVPVGCDVEQIHNIRPSLAKKCLTANEYALYEGCATREEKADLFFRYWTCKESYLKCTGMGLREELTDVEITDIYGNPGVKSADETATFQLFSEDVEDGYKCAWCVKTASICVNVRIGKNKKR